MQPKISKFESELYDRFLTPELSVKTDVRWWMAAGMHTNETIKEEILAMYNAGFSGVELCQLADRTIDESVYGYGGAQWENDVKLILNTAPDLGMSVSLTSGAGWSTANVPGLDPDTQQANQCIVLLKEELASGQTRSGAIPSDKRLREKSTFIGTVAVRKVSENVYAPDGYVVLTSLVNDKTLSWTAPDDGDYTLMYYFSQGTAQAASPAVKKSYTINYFDRRGVEALKIYLENNVLNDPALNKKIKAGDVQYFMDSLEYSSGAGFTSWTENFAEEFRARKGYDILPYMFLAEDAPNTSIWCWNDDADLIGPNVLSDLDMTKQIINDIFDVQTKLYIEEFISPFRSWLNSRGITLRVQISYGKNLEISEPIAAVDRPEAENRNQKNQPDMYRLWTGGAHIFNKVLSSETGGLDNSNYNYTYQRHLHEAYRLYSVGFSRIVWHIWSAIYGPTPVWPGYEGGNGMDDFYKFGTREPSYSDYPMFNDHLGRIQKLLRMGKAGVDLCMINTKYGQHMVHGDKKDWLLNHEGMFFPSLVLQDSGYTYDYLNPSFLDADGVYFDKENKTLELAGYRAIVLWQSVLSVSAAEKIAALAEKGMPVIIVDGAAVKSPYHGDDPAVLASVIERLAAIKNVQTVKSADDVIVALQSLGIDPYVSFSAPNQQILTQTRRVGDDRYIFAYNYSNGDPEEFFSAEFSVNGLFVPYSVDTWTGKVSRVPAKYVDGKTVFNLSLSAGDVAMFGLESVDSEAADENTYDVKIKTPFEITDWDLTVESWTPSDVVLTRTETLLGVTTSEYAYKTDKNKVNVKLDKLDSWDNIESIGKTVSGKGFYRSSFTWDGASDGAYLDFGRVTESMRIKINGVETDSVNMNLARVDISDLIKVGENSIEIEYSSNLNNLQISRGKVRENILVNNFIGYLTKYESYGPKKAVVVPYDKA